MADMVTKLVTVARDKTEGFARYQIPKAGETVPLDKIGYSKLFAPWGWAIGTGAYVTDIDAAFWSEARSDLIAAVCLTVLAGFISYLLGRNLSQALKRLTVAMKSLADGDLSPSVPSIGRRDEVGVMAGAVHVFKENALRSRALEQERAQSEAERTVLDEQMRSDAERSSSAEAAALVVNSIGAGLERLAAGDLTQRLDTPLPPAYEKLRSDLNSATGQLKDLIGGVVVNISAIRSGTGEIATAADDLSRRTEQQAASLEETASALDEITATVQKTADGAKHASEVVSAARADAEQSGRVVQDAVAAMGAIEKSASEISQIIGVIDEIAFQTNLLALNAGVEAARAGEAGRGFAVVASEVRALAQRSADAAKEIKGLIATSSRQVSSGVTLVDETGRALTRILAQVAEIKGIVDEISASAREQATGLQEVNSSVNQMDQVTQQNAAMVEQSTAASHSLAGEAEQLATLVGRFRIGRRGLGAIRARAHPRRRERPRLRHPRAPPNRPCA